MHAYATDSDRERLAILLLVVGSILLAWGLHVLLLSAHLEVPWWLDTPAVLGFYGILWKIYDRYAWRWRWKAIRISDVPDLAGEWHGQVQSSFDGESLNARLTIRQTATHLLIEQQTENSRSTSVMATLNCRPGPFQGLSYVYDPTFISFAARGVEGAFG
jgi:hypothetical protein